jgi:cytochrome c oxidase subunit IV
VSEHIVSPKLYAVIFLALMVGTLLTVWAAYQNFSIFNIVIALVIATVKATLVILFFMHGKYSARRTKLVIVSGFFWLAIMLGLTLADYSSRHHEPSRTQLAAPNLSPTVRS